MHGTVFVNGSFLAATAAQVSVFDRGFLFGDGIYEVVPVVRGRLVDRQYFLERLRHSLGELAMDWPCSETEYLAMMETLIARNALTEGIVYSQVTRGVAPREFHFPAGARPTLIAFTQAFKLLDHPKAAAGIKVVTTPDLRWRRRDIKSINLLGQVLAKQDAMASGGQEGWMVENGLVTEGVSSSAYIVKDGTVITRPLTTEILPGIRRRTLLEIAAANGIATAQRPFSVADAQAADEAFVSSATTTVMPVVAVDGTVIGNGRPGPITQRLRQSYLERMLAEADSQRG